MQRKMLCRVSVLTGQQSKMIKAMLVRATRTSAPVAAESSERDLTNFPRVVRLATPGKVRMGFLPEEWFQAFYNKTGVTGPYVLCVGFATYMISKEYYVCEHEYYTGLSLMVMSYMAVTKLGPTVADYADKEVDKVEKEWSDGRKMEIKNIEDALKYEERSQWQAEGQMEYMKAKRENVAFQYEAEYRKRLMTVYNEVKNRLDFQVTVGTIEQRFAQKNLVEWVVKNVLGSIKTEQEAENINLCIKHLDGLVTKAKPS